MSIASNRSRRPNAGSKMNEVSGKEDDEFYKQAYGGFVEDDNDNEFEPKCSDDEPVDESIRENGESADLDDKEHPPAKRLKTGEAKAGEDAESDEDVESDDDDDEDDDDDDDDDEAEDEEDEGAEEENGEEDDDAEGEGEEEDDEDEADEDDSIDTDAKEKSKKAESEAIPEKSKAE